MKQYIAKCVTVIIPIHNLEKYIGKCLQSIIRQRYNKSQYEIIAVLDSCTDGSEEIVTTTLENSGIAYTILHTNYRNAGLSRNLGLEIARGKYIYFVDGDDYLTDMLALKRLTEAIESGDYNAVYMNKFESDQKAFDDDAIWRYFYTREIIGDTRFTDARINEDWEFTRTIGLCPKMKYHALCAWIFICIGFILNAFIIPSRVLRKARRSDREPRRRART